MRITVRTLNRRTALGPAILAVSLFGSGQVLAQVWTGSVGVAAVTQSSDGSEDSFLSQANLDEGLVLEQLALEYRGKEEDGPEFRLHAWGFGGAEPSQHARLELEASSPWRFRLGYDRRESFFRLQESDFGARGDDWDIERWRGDIRWDGWKPARLGLSLRSTARRGTVQRPIFALNEIYPLEEDLDESIREVGVRLETRELPVDLVFEQTFATHDRDNRRRPAGENALFGDDPDLFVGANDGRSAGTDVTTSRLIATYGGPKVEVVGSVLWSPADLDVPGEVSEAFAIAGGRVGRVEFVDRVVGSAEMDRLAGNLRLGVRLTPKWIFRLEGDHRDTSVDSTLLGERLLRVVNPLGNPFEIAGSVDENGLFDVTETGARLTLEWSDAGWTVWGGALTTTRDVAWRRTEDDPGLDVSRDGDGALFGAAWSRGRVTGSAEIEHGTFDGFVFRTQPESVDRLKLRLAARLEGGWRLHLQGRIEEADNPDSQSALDSSGESLGLGLVWASPKGERNCGFDLDLVNLNTETGLVLPSGQPDLSFYDLSLLTAGAHGSARFGKIEWSGSATRVEDTGETWPVESWIVRSRVAVDLKADLSLGVFGEYWSYDEDRAEADDYDVTRYGLALAWRFQ